MIGVITNLLSAYFNSVSVKLCGRLALQTFFVLVDNYFRKSRRIHIEWLVHHGAHIKVVNEILLILVPIVDIAERQFLSNTTERGIQAVLNGKTTIFAGHLFVFAVEGRKSALRANVNGSLQIFRSFFVAVNMIGICFVDITLGFDQVFHLVLAE